MVGVVHSMLCLHCCCNIMKSGAVWSLGGWGQKTTGNLFDWLDMKRWGQLSMGSLLCASCRRSRPCDPWPFGPARGHGDPGPLNEPGADREAGGADCSRDSGPGRPEPPAGTRSRSTRSVNVNDRLGLSLCVYAVIDLCRFAS